MIHSLPPLQVHGDRLAFPGSASALQRIAELLLSQPEQAPAMVAAWADALEGDPALLLWACTALGQLGEPVAPSLVAVAQRVIARRFELFRWSHERAFPGDPTAVAELARRSVAIAAWSAHLAQPLGSEAASCAWFLGLCHFADAWLHGARDAGQTQAIARPDWLAALADHPGQALVRQAAERIAADRPAPAAADQTPADIATRADQARRLWDSPAPPSATWLPQLAERMARLAALETEFQATLEQEKLASLAEFAAGAGHEMNNPLAVISGRAQLLARDEPHPERRRDLALIHAQARRVHEMIADLNLYARPPAPQWQSVDLTALAAGVLGELAEQAQSQGVVFQRVGEPGPVRLTADPVRLTADPVQLSVALRALCVNALEALHGPGRVEIRLAQDAQETILQVTDDGPGIRAADRPHLFDPFFSGRQAGRGLGLGLSKCWRIVTLHGGRIDVASEPEKGATFTIRIPRRMKGSGERRMDHGGTEDTETDGE